MKLHRKSLLISSLAVSLSVGGILQAQDNPFLDSAPAPATENPFLDPAPAPDTANPFAQGAVAPDATAPAFTPTFGDPPAPGVGAPTDNPFANGAAPVAPADPMADGTTENPFAMDATAPAPAPATANPFATTTDGGLGSPAPAGGAATVNPFAFDAPAAPASGAATGVTTLYDFRYDVRQRYDGTQIVRRVRLTTEEAVAFDQGLKEYYLGLINGGQVPNYAPGSSTTPDEWAQWLVYANQARLWGRYVNEVVLNGTESEEQWEMTNIRWPGDPAPQDPAAAGGQGFQFEGAEGGREGGRERAQRPANIYNENRSLDDQLYDFAPVPDTRGNAATPVIDPAQMDQQLVQMYAQFTTTLRAFEAEQVAFMQGLKEALDTRAQKRAEYDLWRQEQKLRILDFEQEWRRRYEGRVLTVAGVRYELYRPGTVPQNTTRGANIVVTDHDITPYDLLNEDGTLRGPAR